MNTVSIRIWALVFSLMIFSGKSTGQHFISPPKVELASVPLMKKLLQELWQPGFENRDQVDAWFKATQSLPQELTLAYVANRLNDNRTRDARNALELATARDSKFLDGWLIKAHLDILGNDYGQGLMSLRSAKRALDEPNASPVQRAAFYKRTGELIGFLRGPVSNRVDQNLLDATVKNLLDGSKDEDRQSFTAAIDQIRTQFEDRFKVAEARLEDEQNRQAIIDANLQVALSNQNQSLAQSEQVLRTQMNQLQAELGQQESQLTSQLSPLQSNFNSLSAQIDALQWTLSVLYQDLAAAQNAQVVCPITVRSILSQIQLTELNLINLQSRQQAAVAEFNAVQIQMQSVRRNYGDQINEAKRELRQISATMNRNQSQLLRLAGGPQVAAGKKQAETARVVSLSMYIKLPAVLIRQELLEMMESF